MLIFLVNLQSLHQKTKITREAKRHNCNITKPMTCLSENSCCPGLQRLEIIQITDVYIYIQLYKPSYFRMSVVDLPSSYKKQNLPTSLLCSEKDNILFVHHEVQKCCNISHTLLNPPKGTSFFLHTCVRTFSSRLSDDLSDICPHLSLLVDSPAGLKEYKCQEEWRQNFIMETNFGVTVCSHLRQPTKTDQAEWKAETRQDGVK